MNDELIERAGRYGRLMENDDFQKTIKEMDEMFNFDGSAISACNLPNCNEYLWAREGARSYRNKLLALKQETENAIKSEKEGESDE